MITVPLIQLKWKVFRKHGFRSGNMWTSIDYHLPLSVFGSACMEQFQTWFDGKLVQEITSINAMCDYMIGCRHVPDIKQHNQRDVWMHPVDFERLKKGDCEDFSLWAWRRLSAMGYETEFMTGAVAKDGDLFGHAWLVYHDDGIPYLLETSGYSHETMVRPLAEVKHDYFPRASVDQSFQRRLYSGISVTIKLIMAG